MFPDDPTFEERLGEDPAPASLLPLAELAEQAEVDCLEHAAREIPGELAVEASATRVAFDEAHLRYVFEQPMVIWRRLETFDVWVDDDGLPIGFHDAGEAAACEWAEISAAEIVALASASGWLGEGLTPSGSVTRTPDGGARLSIIDASRPSGDDRFEVVVNPGARKLVAIEPVGGTDGAG